MKWSDMTNRERDALVAEKVMGWSRSGEWLSLGSKSIDLSSGWLREEDPDNLNAPGLPHYSTDIAAAWQVVDKLMDQFPQCRFEKTARGTWYAKFWDFDNSIIGASANTAPEAICLAALKVRGVEV